MRKSLYLISAALVSASLISCAEKEPTLMERAEALQRSILTIDTHVDTPMSLLRPDFDVTQEGTGCVDFPKMRAGALDAECFAVFTSQRYEEGYADETYAKAKRLFDTMHTIAIANPDIVGVASSPKDLYDLKSQGKLAILPTIENSVILGGEIARVDTLYTKGARMFGLCHSLNNDLCDSSSDAKGAVFGGLSEFGEQVVARVNELGGIIDVSHASDETFFDVVKLSKTPIAASHSSIRAVTNHDRNFNDEMLLALKENGGVIQICILDRYIKEFPENVEYNAEIAAVRKAYMEVPEGPDQMTARRALRAEMAEIKSKYPDQNATIKDYVDHIDYVVEKIGIDHVGIGTDFDGGGGVADCKDVSQLIGVTAELLSRGYSDEDIEKIWGGNFLRVFNAAIAYSESLN